MFSLTEPTVRLLPRPSASLIMHPVAPFRAAGLALLLSAGIPAPAQAPGAVPAAAGVVDRQSVLDGAACLQRDDQGLCGFGRDYAVRFDGAGMTFTPALGRRAQASRSLVIGLDSVRRGNVALAIDGAAAPLQQDAVASYRRSADVTERYEVRAEGVEHSFVFKALPGTGDLVVRCRLGGELAARGQSGDDGGLQFLAPSLGNVVLGGVVLGGVAGIDGSGARCAGSQRLVEGMLELSLPAAFVDRAVLPLVLDPLIGARIDLGPSPADDREPDAAFDATTGDWLVVWTRVLSATSCELRGRHYNEASGLGSALLLATGTVLRRPRVCNHDAVNRFVVVYEDADSMIGLSTVKAQVVNADRTLGPAVVVTDGTTQCVEPDVCGNLGSGAGDLAGLIVYREIGVGIQRAAYTLLSGNAGALNLAPSLLVAAEPAEHPRLARSAGNRPLLVFGRPGQAVAQSMTIGGALVGTAQTVPVGGSAVPRPAVDGDGVSYLMAFDQEIAPGDRDIRCVQWTWTGSGIAQSGYDAIAQQPNVDEFAPAVALLGPKYLVLWTEAAGFLAYEVHGKTIAATGCAACGIEFTLPGPQASDTSPAIASRRSGGASGSEALVLLSSHGAQPPFQGDVVSWLFTPFSAPPSMPLWNGCGSPVTLQPQGPFALGNSTFALTVGSTDPGAVFGLVSLGIGTAPLQCLGCSFVAPTVLAFLPMAGGSATYALPVPCIVAFLSLQLDVQGAVLGTPSNFCPLLPQLSTSPASRLTLVE